MKHLGGDLAYFADDTDLAIDCDTDTDPDSGSGRVGALPAKAAPQLTELEKQVLGFERQWWRHAGSKEQAIRDVFDLSATRYYQVLNGLLDNPAALAHDPALVGRLRRLRAVHARSRTRAPKRN